MFGAKIPYDVIKDKSLNKKRILFHAYLYFNINAFDELDIFIPKACEDLGYKPNRNKGKVNNELKDYFSYLATNGYIVQPEIKYNRIYAKTTDKMLNPEKFGFVYPNEFQAILERGDDSATIILLLAFLRVRIHRNKGSASLIPEFYHSYLQDLGNDIGINHRKMQIYILALEELSIIHTEKMRGFKDAKGICHAGAYIFVNIVRITKDGIDKSYDYLAETQKAIRHIEIHRSR
mgnify:CR=1 FL=1